MSDTHAERVSLGEAAYRRLHAEIVSCRLSPGQRFTEKQLSVEYGFGVSPLRDALRRLDHDGLVRTLPRKGYQVAPLTPKLVDDLFVMWRIVAPELVRLGIENATDDQIARIRAGFEAIEAASSSGADADHNVRVVEAADMAFTELAQATGNSYLINLLERIQGDMARIWVLILDDDPSAVNLEAPSNWIQHILVDRDAEAAAASTSRLVEDTHERVLRAVTRWPSVMRAEVELRSASSR